MNEKAYDRLSPEDRAVIDKVSYETISRTWRRKASSTRTIAPIG